MAQQNIKCGPCDSDKAQVGTILLKFENEPEISKEDSKYEMVLEVIGHGKRHSQLGNDIVMVLDTRRSMGGEKLEAMKEAARLMIDKLSELDNLWIITFDRGSQEEYDFVPMTTDDKEDAISIVDDDLTAHGYPNIGAALRRGLKILGDRRSPDAERHGAIVLMSDGVQFDGAAAEVSSDRFPVFTFGFGAGTQCNSQILKQIAGKSKEGVFYQIDRTTLNGVIHNFMDWLLSKTIKDVKLVIIPLKGAVSRTETCTTEIKHVYAGKYLTSTNDKDKSVTVSFGNLREKEMRTVLVDLFLPKVTKMVHIDSLRLYCLYSDVKGNSTKTNPLIFRVKRYQDPKVPEPYAKRVEMAKHELGVHKKSQTVKCGPYGSPMRENYRLSLEEGDSIKEVIINHGFIVDAIGFVILKKGFNTPTTQLFGGTRGNQSKIVLKQGECITGFSGVYGKYMYGNLFLIAKISVHTNLCPKGYGPFGQAKSMVNQYPFSTPNPIKGPIVGFFGRHNNYLESIGIFVKQDC